MAQTKLYKITKDPDNIENGVSRDDGGGSMSYIPKDPDNTDYQEYLAWVAAGNTADAAD